MLERENFERRLDLIMDRLHEGAVEWRRWFGNPIGGRGGLSISHCNRNIIIEVDLEVMLRLRSRVRVRQYLETEYAIQSLAGTVRVEE